LPAKEKKLFLIKIAIWSLKKEFLPLKITTRENIEETNFEKKKNSLKTKQKLIFSISNPFKIKIIINKNSIHQGTLGTNF